MLVEDIIKFFNENLAAKIILDAYLTVIIIGFLVYLAFKFKKVLNLIIIGLVIGLCYFISSSLNLNISSKIYEIIMSAYLLMCVVILAPELRKLFEYHKKNDSRNDMIISSTQATKEAIVDAVFNMSATKVGALITIEQHNSLDQYAERAITLNSDISREIIEQIFIKDSPLHDGGVIIRGNKIVCAGAYYVLTQDDTLDKTVGSRHRAGVGISEITDSLTIIVSEETGAVHVANAGFMKVIDNKNELLEYLNLFLGRS